MEIPGAVTHPVDAIYPAPALIPAVRRGKRSVTEQISVCCFLSRPDRPALTTEAVILPATVENVFASPMRLADAQTQSAGRGTQITRRRAPARTGPSRSTWTRTEKQKDAFTCSKTALSSPTSCLKTRCEAVYISCRGASTSSHNHLSTFPGRVSESEHGWIGPWAPHIVNFLLKTPFSPRY